MDLTKHLEFFNPDTVTSRVHIIGCGAIGSNLAIMLARIGINRMSLYDFDTVDEHNITNQAYDTKDLKLKKVECLAEKLLKINPEMDILLFHDGYEIKNPPRISGYVFLAVDSIELRQQIAKQLQPNQAVKAVFDFRMRLTDAQHYAADWSKPRHVKALIDSMDFTDEEAKKGTPVSACNTTLSINPTVQMIVSLGVANFINFVKEPDNLKILILADAFAPGITAM
jgi:molybdopterin/thiamine biosynthesis adenylyltransferase